MDNGFEIDMETQLVEDLTEELQVTDVNFNPAALRPKVRNAIREVKQARKYPDYYTDEQIKDDMYEYYGNIRSLSLYDYNTIGMEFQSASTENSVGRTMVDRNKCFAGIIPLSRL